MIHYFSHKIYDATRENNFLVKAFFRIVYDIWVFVLHLGSTDSMREELSALAENSGLGISAIRRAISLPDSAGAINKLGSHPWFRFLPSAGCTSLAMRDKNRFLYGRNLDFAGVGLWDAYPTLTIHWPSPGSDELRHISIGAAGAHLGGITGFNEAGISFAVHQNYTKDFSLGGIPMFFVGEMVLRKARNLEDALKVLEQYRPGPLWTFVVTDLKSGQAMAVESSKKHFAVRKMEGDAFAQTNHSMHEQTRAEEFISLGTKMNSQYRMQTVLESVKSGPKNASQVAKILSQQADPQGNLSAYHDILKGHTIQTAIFEKDASGEMHLYVSYEQAPSSGGKYLHFRFKDLFAEPKTRLKKETPYRVVDLAQTPPAKRQKQIEISQAFRQYFDDFTWEKSAQTLAQHQSLNAALFQATVAYQLAQYHSAQQIADAALGSPKYLGEPSYILQSLEAIKILAFKQKGEEAEAKRQAANFLAKNPQNKRLRLLMEKIAQGEKIASWENKLSFEFFSGDLAGREL